MSRKKGTATVDMQTPEVYSPRKLGYLPFRPFRPKRTIMPVFGYIRHCLIILVLAVLATGVGGKTYICFMPDGDVHLGQSRSSCDLSGCDSASANTLPLSKDQVESQGLCLDVSLGDAPDHNYRSFVQLPPLAMARLEPPNCSQSADKKPLCTAPAVIPPQLASLQSVILLI